MLAVEPMPAAHALLLRNVREHTSYGAAGQRGGGSVTAVRCGVGAAAAAEASFTYAVDRPGESHRDCHAAEAAAQSALVGIGIDSGGGGGSGPSKLVPCTAPVETISGLMAWQRAHLSLVDSKSLAPGLVITRSAACTLPSEHIRRGQNCADEP